MIPRIRESMDRQLKAQADYEAYQKQRLFELGRQCKGTSDSLSSSHRDQAEVHLMTSMAEGVFLAMSAICMATGNQGAASALNTVGSTITPQASRYWTQDGERKKQTLEFQLRTEEQMKQEFQNNTPQQNAEMLRQLATRLMELYGALFRLGG